MPASAPPVSPLRPLLVLGCVAVAFMALFMLVDVSGPWDFVLPFRGKKVATALLVGYAVAVSTVLFQTVTGNRVLTPAIMGFDYLYVLIQTCLVFFLGSTTVAGLDPGSCSARRSSSWWPSPPCCTAGSSAWPGATSTCCCSPAW